MVGGGVTSRFFAFLCVLSVCTLFFFGCSSDPDSDSDDGSSDSYPSISDSYTITYKTADGTVLGTKEVSSNSPVTFETAFATKPGYKATKFCDADGKEVLSGVYQCTGDVTITVTLAPISYTVTFTNEKGAAPTSVTRKYGDSSLYLLSGEYKLSDLPGYVFVGWYDEDGESCSYISSMHTSDLNLTAKWKPWTATVYFYVNGNYITYRTVTYDEEITLPKISGDTAGKYVAGWTTSSTSTTVAYDAEGAYTWKGSEDHEMVRLYAVLKDLPMNVSVSAAAPSQTDDIKVTYTSASKCFTATLPGVTSFAWFIDGKKMDGEVGATLSIYKLSDTGLHSIMATAEIGDKILSGTLLVNIVAEE